MWCSTKGTSLSHIGHGCVPERLAFLTFLLTMKQLPCVVNRTSLVLRVLLRLVVKVIALGLHHPLDLATSTNEPTNQFVVLSAPAIKALIETSHMLELVTRHGEVATPYTYRVDLWIGVPDVAKIVPRGWLFMMQSQKRLEVDDRLRPLG